jgi:CheY-like chemotaxis protein
MNSILGMVELLGETSLTPEQRKYLETLAGNGDALLTLINGILELARIESGRVSLEQTEFELEELIEHVAETLAVRAHEKKLELTTRIRAGTPGSLIGDPLRLRQVLINLIGNAIKFTEQGEVAIAVEAESCEADQVRLRFSVRDTGIGIAPEQLDAIFQSFTQADSSATRRYGGAGLGLTIASRLVEQMGGRLAVASELGRGSTFEFIAQLKSAEQQIVDSRARLDLAGVRIILIGDNETNRMVLGEMLGGLGAQISEAVNGRIAIEAATRANSFGAPFDLILLDATMPATDAFELAAELRRLCGEQARIIVMLNSEGVPRARESANARGFDAYLLKPLRRHELMRAIGWALGKAEQRPEHSDHATTPASADDPQLRRLNLLLVDDSVDNRNLVLAYLKKLPYQIDQAENGEVAFARFISGKYDLVLMDMQMPVLDGYGSVRKIRGWERANALAPTPIAALTASALEEDVQRTIEAGCSSHMSKPIKKSRLLQAIVDLTQSPDAAIENDLPTDVESASASDATPDHPILKRRDIDAMAAALERRDYHTLRSLARRTRSVGAGRDAIGNIGDALEDAAQRRDVAEASRQLRALTDCLGRLELLRTHNAQPTASRV